MPLSPHEQAKRQKREDRIAKSRLTAYRLETKPVAIRDGALAIPLNWHVAWVRANRQDMWKPIFMGCSARRLVRPAMEAAGAGEFTICLGDQYPVTFDLGLEID